MGFPPTFSALRQGLRVELFKSGCQIHHVETLQGVEGF